MNGRDVYTSANGGDPERADDLLAPAADKVLELADPYIAPASLKKRLEIARRIIAVGPETDPIVCWTHNLVGNRLSDQHKTEEAIAEYRKAIELDPRFAAPHNNLGTALSDQYKPEEAIGEYREAIELDPRLAAPHNNLAIILAPGKTGEADAEDQKAKKLGAKHPD